MSFEVTLFSPKNRGGFVLHSGDDEAKARSEFEKNATDLFHHYGTRARLYLDEVDKEGNRVRDLLMKIKVK